MTALAALREATGSLTACWLAELEACEEEGRVTLRLLDIPYWDEATQDQGVWSAVLLFAGARATWRSGQPVISDGSSVGPSGEPPLRLDLTGSRLSEGRLDIETLWTEAIGIGFQSVEVRIGSRSVLAPGPG